MPRVNTENFLQESAVQLNMAKSAQALYEVLGPLPVEFVANVFMTLSDDDKTILTSSLSKIKIDSEDPTSQDDDLQGATLDQLARSIARFKIKTNSALGRKTSIGESEAYLIAKSALLDALAA